MTRRGTVGSKVAPSRMSPVAVRELAQVHTAEAVRVLAEVATSGSSEASRIAAAMALLDRGYGKSGAAAVLEKTARVPIVYRIELIDGSEGSPADGEARDDPN